eukprot:CAMPEP_0114536276 /NCGR_PEP_ID=MMETSP0109-20121206/28901_1 /TAXON_ID=29199 /ORGANISM="Chlorarachnion reptans, Strain CCCM449" /LENGTH=201 /DNA_ID=CAMNT_0001719973 /DNA_START=75 /DNA_END=680 /DNA_ORIENTATION=-
MASSRRQLCVHLALLFAFLMLLGRMYGNSGRNVQISIKDFSPAHRISRMGVRHTLSRHRQHSIGPSSKKQKFCSEPVSARASVSKAISERKPSFQFIRNVDERIPSFHMELDMDIIRVSLNFTNSEVFKKINGVLLDEEGLIYSDEVWIADHESPLQPGDADAVANFNFVDKEKYYRLMRFVDRLAQAYDLDFDSKRDQPF